MAYDEGLAQRIREQLTDEHGVVEKQMFGGVAFLLGGNMSVGVIKDEMCVRVGPDAYEAALAQPGARLFDFSGRPMKGWVMVGTEGLADDDTFAAWVARGVSFARSLPPK